MISEQLFQEIMDIGIALTAERDNTRLMELILDKAMDVANCDGGTFYLYEPEFLHFNIMRTVSKGIVQGGTLGKIELPPVELREENVCAYAAIHREVINIEDVYSNDRFDFSGPMRYDAILGYRTKSMMVVPLRRQGGELIGVLQLINALDKDGQIIPFDSSFGQVILFLASQAAVAMSNIRYLDEVKELLQSFAAAMGTAVDARTPYNGNHTRKVTELTNEFTLYLHRLYEAGLYGEAFDNNRREQLALAAALHDIGKITVPPEVMDKGTRLGNQLEQIEHRMELIELWSERDYLKGRTDQEIYEQTMERLKQFMLLVKQINDSGFLTEELEAKLSELKDYCYIKEDGVRIDYLTPYELECLSIKKGTLTKDERITIESHAIMTTRILANIQFKKVYQKVPEIAGRHHEFLDGSGYPDRLKADDISTDVRILSITDVYDALACEDRPYKKPLPIGQALRILDEMVDEGKLDRQLVDLFTKFIIAKESMTKGGLDEL